ncbi:hypothetical protein Tco_1183641 [Tanacetum coccineum]
MDEDATNIEGEGIELYRDVNVNLEGRDAEITDAHQTIAQTTQMFTVTTPVITYLGRWGGSAGMRCAGDSSIHSFHLKPATNTSSLTSNLSKFLTPRSSQLWLFIQAQVSKMLPRIEKMVNEQLEAKVMTHSSNESKTSHAVAANLSELELKKILIDKMERNKSIHRSNEQTNLYNALVEAYESDKLILETYSEMVTFKRCREDEDKDKEPSTGSNRGSKRR